MNQIADIGTVDRGGSVILELAMAYRCHSKICGPVYVHLATFRRRSTRKSSPFAWKRLGCGHADGLLKTHSGSH